MRVLRAISYKIIATKESAREKRNVSIESSLELFRKRLYGRNSYQKKSNQNENIPGSMILYWWSRYYFISSFQFRRKTIHQFVELIALNFNPTLIVFVLLTNSIFPHSEQLLGTLWQFELQPEFPHGTNY